MVRPVNVARSRACQQCKRKRIKCDLHDPCHRCVESSIVCSGPVSGLLMVHASAGSFSQARMRVSHLTPDLDWTQPLQYNLPASLSTGTSAIDDVLLWKFLSYFSQNAGGRSWTAKLPSLVAAKNARAMKSAARAVSLAYAAQNLHDPSIAHAAREYYGNSLRFHQYSFKAPPGRPPCKKKAINALPVTVLLSYFEMIQATSSEAWLNHTLAAERLFALVGPEALEDDLLNHLYFIVRANSATRCFLLGSRTQLRERRWSDINIIRPCGEGTAIFNSLVDIIISLSSHMDGTSVMLAPTLVARDIATLNTNLDELKALWNMFSETIGLNATDYPLVQSNDTLDQIARTDKSQDARSELPNALQEPSRALAAAFFHGATMLLLTLLHADKHTLSAHSNEANASLCRYFGMLSGSNYRYALQYHCDQILMLSCFLRTFQIGCACARMVFPLTVVHRMSPTPHQRLMAAEMFRDWCSSDGLPGLALLAFAGASTVICDGAGPVLANSEFNRVLRA